MKKLIFFASLAFLSCTSVQYDDGTNKNNSYVIIKKDDGTNKYAPDTKQANSENTSYTLSTPKSSQDFAVKTAPTNNPTEKIKSTKDKDANLSLKVSQTKSNKQKTPANTKSKIKENPKTSNVAQDKIMVSKTKKADELISSKYSFFYPVDEFNILNNYNQSLEKRSPGLDFKVSDNTSVKSTAPGLVIFSGHKPALGNSIFVFHNEGFISIYYKLKKLTVNKGDYIKTHNTHLAYAGDIFHYELRKQTKNGIVSLDPKKFLQKRRK